MGRIEGIEDYQSILAGLGILLFLVLLFALVYYIVNNRSVKYLLPFFLVPIVMIGFPALRKIQIGNTIIDLRESIAALEENPEDSEALEELEKQLPRLEQSENLQPRTLVTIAQAHAVRGDTAAAITYVDSALELEPDVEVPIADWVEIVRAQLRQRNNP